ncbi:MAG: carbohydrate kinase, partial [Mesorhizobium sp.]|nr:carbohydrate kinase [Mesorhizobium sp.]
MILCCGEALIDMLPPETTRGESAFAPYSGGAVFNTAIALGRLGAPVEFFTGLSSDLFGDMLRRTLAESRVGTRYSPLSARPTTLAFVKLTNGQAKYVFYDENTAGRMLAEADLPALNDDVSAMLFGAISLIPEPCGSAYEALMRREHATRVTMLDPNIRPNFIPDAAAHRARMMRMVAMADIVKLSDEDLAWFGETGDAGDIARRWLGLGPKLILVTRGGEGATGYTATATVKVPARRVEVVDTVGAGDTFNAGVLAALHERGVLTKSAVAKLDEDDIRS